MFDSRGTISSPKFDAGYYPDSTTCNWRIISGDKRKKIKISFTAFEVNRLMYIVGVIMYASLDAWQLLKWNIVAMINFHLATHQYNPSRAFF